MFNKINKACTHQLLKNDFITTILYFIATTLPTFACAQSSESPIGQGLYYLVNNFIYGTDGIVIATLSVGGCFAAACFHKMQWTSFIVVLAAISGFFGSSAIVSGIKALVST